jgi:hypothetical protein
MAFAQIVKPRSASGATSDFRGSLLFIHMLKSSELLLLSSLGLLTELSEADIDNAMQSQSVWFSFHFKYN